MKIIIPMAGNGSRFAEKGFVDPKPFISVQGKPMIQRVVHSLNMAGTEHIFLAKKEHIERYDFKAIFPYLDHKVVPIEKTTQGAALTVLQTEHLFEQDEDILIVNSDQLFTYNNRTINEVRESDVAGCIWCFEGSGNNWSYAKLDDNGFVIQVAEKKQISNLATGGMYYWRSFRRFKECVMKMIEANDRTNNEFYVAPTYNYLSADEKVIVKMLDGIDQLGTPEELAIYNENRLRLSRNH